MLCLWGLLRLCLGDLKERRAPRGETRLRRTARLAVGGVGSGVVIGTEEGRSFDECSLTRERFITSLWCKIEVMNNSMR